MHSSRVFIWIAVLAPDSEQSAYEASAQVQSRLSNVQEALVQNMAIGVGTTAFVDIWEPTQILQDPNQPLDDPCGRFRDYGIREIYGAIWGA